MSPKELDFKHFHGPHTVSLRSWLSSQRHGKVSAYGNWKGKTVKVEPDNSHSGTSHFDSIDLQTKTARLIGNAGAGDVSILLGVSGLTFIEQTGAGNFSFTTIFPFYKQNTTEFIAVTSRHMNLIKYLLPFQYHGTCKVWE
jgi:hypothetical protein